MISIKKVTIFFIILTSATPGFSQEESNLQKYTPSILFQKGEWEVVSFFNLYTQTEARDRNGDIQNLGQRQTFLNANFQFTYGVSKNGRFNIGVDFMVNRALYDSKEGSPLKVVYGSADFNRTVVSAIGPRLKFVPIAKLPNLSIESTFLLPVAKNLENPQFVAHDRYTWWTRFFYDHKISSAWRVFLETGFLYRIGRDDSQGDFFRIPASVFVSYFPSSKISLYTFGQYAPRFETIANEIDEQFGLNSWFVQVGVGMKYQLLSALEIEATYGNFIASRNDGAGYLLNLGLRYIKR
jgi:hypothetical protein